MGKEFLKESIKYHTESLKVFGTLVIAPGAGFFTLLLKAGHSSDWDKSTYIFSLVSTAIILVLTITLLANSHSKTMSNLKELEENEAGKK